MLKLIGALCVMAGAVWWCLGAVGGLRLRRETLEGLREGLAYLREELTFRLAPLPELLERLGQRGQGAAGAFFQDVLAQLRLDPEGGLRQSWRQAMVRQLPMLRQEERQALLEVGQVLGRYDAKAQGKALAQSVERLERFQLQAGEEVRRLGRVYTAVAVAAGAGLVLVLI